MILYYQVGKLSTLGRFLAIHVGPLKPHTPGYEMSKEYILVTQDGVQRLPGMPMDLNILEQRYTKTEKKTDIVRDLIEKGLVE